MTSASYSADNQKIIVEITDDWTDELVEKIIKAKQVDKKCNIFPIRINKILGQLFSQFSLMPELNMVYRELFSNKGATFYSRDSKHINDEVFIDNYIENHRHAIPLTIMEHKGKKHAYFSADSEKSIDKTSVITEPIFNVSLNENYWLEKKNIIILGHNSRCHDIMRGFLAFTNEWQRQDTKDRILNIVVIDDKKNLEKMNHYKDYSFVTETISAEIYDRELICNSINRVISQYDGDASILILSDDSVLNDDIDANALANLVYVQDIINSKIEEKPDFDTESIDVVVEIIDPKHHDIVNSYSINNIVISNRYISKMITQIGEKEAMFEFYSDILTYDEEGSTEYESKEVYSKKVSDFFKEIPEKCSVQALVRAVYRATKESEKLDSTMVLGYYKYGGKLHLFEGNQNNSYVELDKKDKIIVFSNH